MRALKYWPTVIPIALGLGAMKRTVAAVRLQTEALKQAIKIVDTDLKTQEAEAKQKPIPVLASRDQSRLLSHKENKKG